MPARRIEIFRNPTATLPGATRTASWDGGGLPEERFMSVEDVAETVYAAYSLSKRTV